MSATLPFLLELGVEEIPHWMIVPALGDFQRLFQAFLEEHRLTASALQFDGTPRRLVLRIDSLQARQEDRDELVMGPPKSAAYKDGKPTGAALGFAKKMGVEPDALLLETTPKGEYLAVRRKVEGRDARTLLAEALPGLITRIPWPKAMYWTGKDGARFIRPIRWIVALLGDQVVEFELAGVKSGALSRGHRRMGSTEIAFDHANYEERLEKNGVILSADQRRQKIQSEIAALLKGGSDELVADDALLEDLVYLTEYPTPILGTFDEKFLDLPAEVLTTVMRHHQRYFTLRRPDGSMAPAFVAVMNIKADTHGYVRKGNERVLEARFNDARFFWEVDQQRKLADRVPDLANVTFQAKLGSYLEKTKRVQERVKSICAELNVAPESAERAALLAKTDLTTDMVKELTELQGVMGGLYARAQGEPEAVWKAIYDHYLPQSMDDPIPSTLDGQIVSLADKLDTLASCFSIGMVPTGSKDPFALRRAAQGVVKILAESRLNLGLGGVTPELREFLNDRIRYYYRDVRGFKYDEVNAVLATQPPSVLEIEDRLQAVRQVRDTEDFVPLAAAFKRIRNILRQADHAAGAVDPSLFQDGAERALFEDVEKVQYQVERLTAQRDYIAALQLIATLRPAVDRFFDGVLVNAPEAQVRANRLNLLSRILIAFSSIADFSEIVSESSSE